MTLMEQGVSETTPFNRDDRNWTVISRVKLTHRYVYIFVSPCSAHIIPCSAFASRDEAKAFYREAESRWKAAKAAKA